MRASCAATARRSSSWRSTSGPGRHVRRKIEICARAYKMLTEEVGFPPEDIIFDPNIFAVATGIEEHGATGRFHRGNEVDREESAARAYFRRR